MSHIKLLLRNLHFSLYIFVENYTLFVLILSINTEDQFSSVVQLCLTLCDSMDCSLPGLSVHGILQAGILEWRAIPFSMGSS